MSSKLVGYCDSACAGDIDGRKSTTRYVFFMRDTSFLWNLKKQPIVTLSTSEAEYLVACSCVCQAIWIRRVLEELKMPQNDSTKLLVDKMSTIALTKYQVFHERSKHINTRYHFIRECIKRNELELNYVKF